MAKNTIKPKPEELESIAEQAAQSALDDARLSAMEEAELAKRKKAKPKPMAQKASKKNKASFWMSGSFVLKDSLLDKHWKFILFLFAMALFLIANNYFAEGMARKSAKLKKELKELRFKQVSTQSDLMDLSKQSHLARLLDSSGIKESLVPPIKIKLSEK